jgi:mono/diheme cytochrome c family protein
MDCLGNVDIDERRDSRARSLEEAKMKPVWMVAALVGAVVGGQPWAAFGQQKVDIGKREFDANCAVCHGSKGKGDGPWAGYGKEIVSDLTSLARKNNGVFPFARVYEFIDGTQVVRAHGTKEMPIWGTDYRVGAEYYMDVPYGAEIYVRTRILALTEYVYRLQAK